MRQRTITRRTAWALAGMLACGEPVVQEATTATEICLVADETCGGLGYVDVADCAANLVDDGGCALVERDYLTCALPCVEAGDCATFRACEDACLADTCGG